MHLRIQKQTCVHATKTLYLIPRNEAAFEILGSEVIAALRAQINLRPVQEAVLKSVTNVLTMQ